MDGQQTTLENLEVAARVGELLGTALGPAGAPFVLLPGPACGGQVRVCAAGHHALAGRRLARWARSPGVLALLERSAGAMDRSCGGGTATLLTMLAGAVEHIRAECRAWRGSVAGLQRIRVALAERGSWVLHRIIVPSMREAACAESSHDFWALVTAVLHTAIACKVGARSVEAGVKVVVEWMRLCWPDAPKNFGTLRLPRRVPLVVESGADAERSYVVRGVVLRAGLASPSMPVRLTSVRFVVLRRALKDVNHHHTRSRSQNYSHTIAVSSSAHADHLRRAPIAAFHDFLGSLQKVCCRICSLPYSLEIMFSYKYLRRAPMAEFNDLLGSLHQLQVRVVMTTAPIEEDEAGALARIGIQAMGTCSEKSLYCDPLY